MVRFGILDCPVCLPSILLADTSAMVVSYVVAFVSKASN
jgi:hypothetical protein